MRTTGVSRGIAVMVACGGVAVAALVVGVASQASGVAARLSATTCPGGSSNSNVLFDIAGASASDAWTVGYDSNPARTLIERWKGTTWNVQKSPKLHGVRDGVAAGVSVDDRFHTVSVCAL